jgi:hypothetical protein
MEAPLHNPADAFEFATAVLTRMIPAGLGDRPGELLTVADTMVAQFGVTKEQAADLLVQAAGLLSTTTLN